MRVNQNCVEGWNGMASFHWEILERIIFAVCKKSGSLLDFSETKVTMRSQRSCELYSLDNLSHWSIISLSLAGVTGAAFFSERDKNDR